MMIVSDSVAREAEDQFGRGTFADVVANILRTLPPNESNTIGLFAPWGAGKSTFLGMVRNRLKSSTTVKIIQFNPWLHDTQWQLLEHLFNILSEELGRQKSSKLKTVAKHVAAYGKELVENAQLSISVPMVGVGVSRVPDKAKSKRKDFHKSKEKLSKALTDSGLSIVVEIDDLDRLEKGDILNFFRLINLTLGIPNLNFLLAVDRQVVLEAISSEKGFSKTALDKFIQVPIYLPPPATTDSWNFTWMLVKNAFDVARISLSDDDWRKVNAGLRRSFEQFITTPRQSKKLANAMLVPLLSTGADVDPYDLIHIEGIRALYPELHEFIRNSLPLFLSDSLEYFGPKEESEARFKIELDRVLDCVEHSTKKRMLELLSFLFPKMMYPDRFSTAYYDSLNCWKSDGLDDRRVQSRAYSPEFFTYAPGSTGVRESSVLEFLRITTNEGVKAGMESLMSFVTTENEWSFLETAGRRIPDVEPKDSLGAVVEVLANKFKTKHFGMEKYWAWHKTIVRAVEYIPDSANKKSSADKVIKSQERIDSKIALFESFSKPGKRVVRSDAWVELQRRALTKQSKQLISKKTWPTSSLHSAYVRAAWEFVSANKAGAMALLAKHVLSSTEKTEILLHSFRSRWSDGSFQFREESIAILEATIGAEYSCKGSSQRKDKSEKAKRR